jgi:hypothetical protein
MANIKIDLTVDGKAELHLVIDATGQGEPRVEITRRDITPEPDAQARLTTNNAPNHSTFDTQAGAGIFQTVRQPKLGSGHCLTCRGKLERKSVLFGRLRVGCQGRLRATSTRKRARPFQLHNPSQNERALTE